MSGADPLPSTDVSRDPARRTLRRSEVPTHLTLAVNTLSQLTASLRRASPKGATRKSSVLSVAFSGHPLMLVEYATWQNSVSSGLTPQQRTHTVSAAKN